MGIPVGVIDDDSVSRCEVDAEAAGARGEQEDKHVRVTVENTHGLLPLLPCNAAIDARGAVAQLLQVCVQKVQHLGHLARTAGENIDFHEWRLLQEYMVQYTHACNPLYGVG